MKIVSAEKKLVAPLTEECIETVEEVKLAKTTHDENENSCKCPSLTPYIVSMIVVFISCTGINAYFIYYNWSLVNVSRISTRTQTTIY